MSVGRDFKRVPGLGGSVRMASDPEPGAAVFTTLRWKAGRVAWLDFHISRLRSHAERVGIDWPEDFRERLAAAVPQGEGDLCRIRLHRDGEVTTSLRTYVPANSPLRAVSHAAPVHPIRVQGTKHGAWQGYRHARTSAREREADIALLVRDGSVIDADRCTPILLDRDGVAHVAPEASGGVDSITLALLTPGIEAAGIPVRRSPLNETLLGRAAEVLVLGTGIGVAWIGEIDGQAVSPASPGPLFEAASAAFSDALASAWTPLTEVVS